MSWIEALILGMIQGLTEFLPVSSSGHLEIGKALLNINPEKSLIFTVIVHGATVLSTIVVFRKSIFKLFKGLFAFKWNEETQYCLKLIVSMIPVAIIGLFFHKEIENLFTENILFVGIMLIVTGLLLTFSYFTKQNEKPISYKNSFIIGIAQAIAVIPGISRSGSTIATGLILGNKKEKIAEFSFLMVLIPIIGGNIKDIRLTDFSATASISSFSLIVGFISAFVFGLFACKWMINIVKKGKLIYFAIYCFIIGFITIGFKLFF